LILDQPLCWVAMQVELAQIPKDLRDPLTGLLESTPFQGRNIASPASEKVLA